MTREPVVGQQGAERRAKLFASPIQIVGQKGNGPLYVCFAPQFLPTEEKTKGRTKGREPECS